MEEIRYEFSPLEWIDDRLSQITATGGSAPQPAGQTQTTATSQPWSGQIPFLTGGTDANGNPIPGTFPSAAALYNQGGPQYFNGATVAAQSPATLQAQQQAIAFGSNPNGIIDSSNSAAANLLDPNFLNSTPGASNLASAASATNPALGLATSQAMNAPGANVLGSIASNPYAPSSANYLMPYASGMMLGANPYLDQQFNTAAGNITNAYQTAIAPQITSQSESGYRYGSGAADNAQAQGERQLASQLSTLGANLYGQNYAQQTQNQLNAANSLVQAQQAQQAQQIQAATNLGQSTLGATGLLGQLGNQQAQTQIGAASALGNDYNNTAQNQVRALFASPSLATLPLQQAAAVANAGQSQDAYSQALLNSQIQAFNYNQTLPWNTLSAYEGLINGNYGGTTTSSTPYYNSGGGLGSSLGGGLSGAASGAMLGSAFGPWGAGIGGVTGGLLGLFSDRRLKELYGDYGDAVSDLNEIAVVNGRYLWDNETEMYPMVIAQQVQRIFPHAVAEVDGMKMVHFAHLVPALIAAVQELSAQVAKLKKEKNA